MYPVPQLATLLTTQWAEQLAAHLGVSVEAFRAEPVRHLAFENQTVTVELMDRSQVNFRWAFPLIDKERRTIAVFTEHCGHHLFPIHEARVLIDGKLVFEDVS